MEEWYDFQTSNQSSPLFVSSNENKETLGTTLKCEGVNLSDFIHVTRLVKFRNYFLIFFIIVLVFINDIIVIHYILIIYPLSFNREEIEVIKTKL